MQKRHGEKEQIGTQALKSVESDPKQAFNWPFLPMG
jgi:hypothetical protein